ncbi:hypothetical protein BGZ50_000834, partial [Haplosporangium sp. Z 11]
IQNNNIKTVPRNIESDTVYFLPQNRHKNQTQTQNQNKNQNQTQIQTQIQTQNQNKNQIQTQTQKQTQIQIQNNETNIAPRDILQLQSIAVPDPETDPEPTPEEVDTASRESHGDHAPLLQIEGSIKKQAVSFMIDSGANRNFLSRSAAKRLGLQLTRRTEPEHVNLADSHGLLITHYAITRVFFGKVKQVLLFDILDVKFDAILAINWLTYSYPRPSMQ